MSAELQTKIAVFGTWQNQSEKWKHEVIEKILPLLIELGHSGLKIEDIVPIPVYMDRNTPPEAHVMRKYRSNYVLCYHRIPTGAFLDISDTYPLYKVFKQGKYKMNIVRHPIYKSGNLINSLRESEMSMRNVVFGSIG